MAEIRKFDPALGNAIAQALNAAMGEPVRPRVPGTAEDEAVAEPSPATPVAADPAVVTVRFTARTVSSDDATSED